MVKEKKAKAKSKSLPGGTGVVPGAAIGSGALPDHLELQKTRVICGPDLNYNVSRHCDFRRVYDGF